MNRKDFAAAAIFVAIVLIFCLAIDRVTSASDEAELGLVRDAVKNAALTCYAVEGAYPDDLDYLREHYGLGYNEDRYLVYYEAFASNVMPDIRVMERGRSQP
ncbi:MAG: hypothetical protein J6K13_03270 [Clostridia bacterium]|nr:hypothetical protein [Clostridia bacterium]